MMVMVLSAPTLTQALGAKPAPVPPPRARFLRGRQMEPEDEAAADDRGGLEEGAAIGAHAGPPFVPAARWIAARTRW